jgi:MOSC domain-containing protein YiiM
MPTITVQQILTGALRPLGPRAVPSGIDKHPVGGPLYLGAEGLSGDAQGDPRNHGGPEKAVHLYPFDHYALWQAELGPVPLLQQPGGFGENLSTTGITEHDVAVGDVFALGEARIQVSQGRSPCWKLNQRFGVKTMARQVQQTGRIGWYYRVLQPGTVTPGDALVCVDRPHADWTVHRLWHFLFVDPLNTEALAEIAALTVLSPGWRQYAERRLENAAVESWEPRLNGEG